MKDRTILLTGATGFLGSHLLESLICENYNIIILKRSFSRTWRIDHWLHKVISYDLDKVPLEQPFEEHRIDIIIHTATNYGRKGERVSQIVDTNLLFPLKLLDTAICFNTDAFFNTDTLLYKYLNNYTLSKKQFVEWLEIISNNIKVINMKIEHIYGPKDDNNKFVTWLINELLSHKKEIKLTRGQQKRDFIYISDVVSAYMAVLNNLDILSNFNNYDVGTGNFISIKDFVIMTKNIIEQHLSTKIETNLNFGALPYRKGELEAINEDLSELAKLGWKPTIDVECGLKKTVQFQLEQVQ